MEKEQHGWYDALSEQDIPAEAVNWQGITAAPDEEELSDSAGLLDVEDTIGEAPSSVKTKGEVKPGLPK